MITEIEMPGSNFLDYDCEITRILIGRSINGISINGLEYLLDKDNKEMIFENIEKAKKYLKENGYTNEMIEDEITFVNSETNEIL